MCVYCLGVNNYFSFLLSLFTLQMWYERKVWNFSYVIKFENFHALVTWKI